MTRTERHLGECGWFWAAKTIAGVALLAGGIVAFAVAHRRAGAAG